MPLSEESFVAGNGHFANRTTNEAALLSNVDGSVLKIGHFKGLGTSFKIHRHLNVLIFWSWRVKISSNLFRCNFFKDHTWISILLHIKSISPKSHQYGHACSPGHNSLAKLSSGYTYYALYALHTSNTNKRLSWSLRNTLVPNKALFLP